MAYIKIGISIPKSQIFEFAPIQSMDSNQLPSYARIKYRDGAGWVSATVEIPNRFQVSDTEEFPLVFEG